MASNGQEQMPGQDHSPNNRSIPLQNLSRGFNPTVEDDDESRGRGGHVARRSLVTGGGVTTYERIAEDSPSPTDRVGLHISQPSIALATTDRNPYVSEDNGSPVDDLGGFAQAMGSMGFGFDQPTRRPPLAGSSSFEEGYMMGTFPGHGGWDGRRDSDDFFSPVIPDEGTVPLTDKRYLQPISGAAEVEEAENERSSMQSVRLGSQYSARLGDDLPNLESGIGGSPRRSRDGRSRSRSLSPAASGSALHMAGSAMRLMSQRVVNLSNEPELVEQTLRRGDSLKSARLDGPPVLPALTEYAHDPLRDGHEKPLSSTAWRTQANPFRGKSLGIFAPNNPLRMWLCDVLVNPITEPFILVVIVIQTILLTIQSSPSVYDNARSLRWGSSSLDYSFLVIFVIYTTELIVKIIVSGFIWNPREYSTLNRSLGLRKALAEKGRSLFSLHRDPTVKKKSVRIEEPQPSFLRTFTGLQTSIDISGDPRQRQRTRLAHRAFLRHSFNRLDFLAVISYWISFGLMIVGYQTAHHVFIFQMLSCLRILRLLGITRGTSVSDSPQWKETVT